MNLLQVAVVLSLCFAASKARAQSPYDHYEFTIPVDVLTNTTTIACDAPSNQTQLTGLIQEAFAATSNISLLQTGSVQLQASYEIYAELFVPSNWENNGTGVLEFAVHG